MKNKTVFLCFFITSILYGSYGVAAHESESDSHAEDSAGSEEVNLELRQAWKLCEKGRCEEAIQLLVHSVPKEALSPEELKIAVKIYELAKMHKLEKYWRKNLASQLTLATQHYFSSDYDAARKIFIAMPSNIRKELSPVYLHIQKMLLPEGIASQLDQAQDFDAKISAVCDLIEQGNLITSAPLFIDLRKSLQIDWTEGLQRQAIKAVEARAEYEKAKARLLKSHGKNKENQPTTSKKSVARVSSNADRSRKMQTTSALANTTNQHKQ